MGTEDFEYLFEKKYSELTDTEKAQLSGMVDSEEEFEGMKDFFSRMESGLTEFTVTPDDAVKAKLDDVFFEKHPKDRGVRLWAVVPVLFPSEKKLWQQPMLRIAALVIVALLVIPLFRIEKDNPVQVADNHSENTDAISTPMEQPDVVNSGKDRTKVEDQTVLRNEPVVNTVSAPQRMTKILEDVPGSIEPEMAAGASFAFAGSTHPDGIYLDEVVEKEVSQSAQKPVSSNMAILDLLTATF